MSATEPETIDTSCDGCDKDFGKPGSGDLWTLTTKSGPEGKSKPGYYCAGCVVTDWNANVPVGSPVRYWKGWRKGPGEVGKTRTAARLLGNQTPVVWIEDVAGCIALTHVEPIAHLADLLPEPPDGTSLVLTGDMMCGYMPVRRDDERAKSGALADDQRWFFLDQRDADPMTWREITYAAQTAYALGPLLATTEAATGEASHVIVARDDLRFAVRCAMNLSALSDFEPGETEALGRLAVALTNMTEETR